MAEVKQESKGLVIWGYSGSITLTCGCGSPIPVIVPFHQGAILGVRCRKCQGTYRLHGLQVQMAAAGNDTFALEFKPHMMVEAASQMPDVPVEELLNNVTPFGPIKR